MKKYSILFVLMLISSVFAVSVSAVDFCIDSDGDDPFVGGFTTTEQGINYDDCDGVSDNHKEFVCDGDEDKFIAPQYNCFDDFGADCVEAEGGDYCDCPQGTEFDEEEGGCVPVEEEPRCGDGIPDEGEECDDEGNQDGDGCNAHCIVEFCGDNVLQEGLGEQCDDGLQGSETCTPNCTLVEEECIGDCPNDIPEFTTIGAGLVLAGAGAYMYRRRSRK